MSIEQYFRDPATNSVIVPVDGTEQLLSILNLEENSVHQFHIVFSDTEEFDLENLDTPTGGTISFEVSSISGGGVAAGVTGQYREGVPNGQFNAADVYSTTRILPTSFGLAKNAHVTLGSVTGVNFALIQYTGSGA